MRIKFALNQIVECPNSLCRDARPFHPTFSLKPLPESRTQHYRFRLAPGFIVIDSARSLQADADGNGTLDYREFVVASLHMQSIDNDEYLRKAFLYFDKDGSGYIEIEEFREALADDFGPDDIDVVNNISNEVDTEKDGCISYEEFASMMKTGTDWRKASRHCSRGRFNSLSVKLVRDGSLQMENNERR